MDEDFRDELKLLIESIFKPEALVIKKIDGKDLIASEYQSYTEKFLKLFQSDDLPKPQSIYETTVEKQLRFVVDECVEEYKERIFIAVPYMTTIKNIEQMHEKCKGSVLTLFQRKKKMGSASHIENFKKILEDEIEKLFKDFSDRSKENIQRREEETERIKKALEEKLLLEKKAEENAKLAEERSHELKVMVEEQKISREKFERELQIAEKRLSVEREKYNNFKESREERQSLWAWFKSFFGY